MKIEKGKFYKTRDGRKAEVLTTDIKGYYPIACLINNTLMTYDNDGIYDSRNPKDELDLISEWKEKPIIPWDDYPTWMNWVAMDEDREWMAYYQKPELRKIEWYLPREQRMTIPKEYEPKNFTGDWKESLFERPKKD